MSAWLKTSTVVEVFSHALITTNDTSCRVRACLPDTLQHQTTTTYDDLKNVTGVTRLVNTPDLVPTTYTYEPIVSGYRV